MYIYKPTNCLCFDTFILKLTHTANMNNIVAEEFHKHATF